LRRKPNSGSSTRRHRLAASAAKQAPQEKCDWAERGCTLAERELACLVFDDLKIDSVSDDHVFVLTCGRAAPASRNLNDPEGGSTPVESDQVVVFDWPALMMQRRSTLGLTYEGPSDVVNRTINAFNNLMVEGSEITVEPLPTDTTGDQMVIDADTLTKFTEGQSHHPYCFVGKTCHLDGNTPVVEETTTEAPSAKCVNTMGDQMCQNLINWCKMNPSINRGCVKACHDLAATSTKGVISEYCQ